ncbi:MAG: trigger factor [Ruminococcaceae bacterium]|nr:trigger factor [Oscillospiraceae bacterium]
MKKRILALLLCLILLVTASACNGKDGKADYNYYDYDLSPYFELGDYKNLKITLYSTVATAEEIDKYCNNYIENTVFTEAVDKAAEKKDTVNINFAGTIDGVAFEGGTASNQEFVLGSGGYIEGFEDGIVGMKAGEVKDINVTFPEDYGTESLNGKAAVFKITMNAVKKEVKGELSDAFLTSHKAEYPTVADLKAAAKTEIEKQKMQYESAQNKDSIISTILETSELKDYPEEEIKRNFDSVKESFESTYTQYTSYGMFSGSMVDFINEYTDMNVKTVDEFYNKYAEDQVRIELVLAAVAKAENITVSAGEIKELSSSYKDYSYESEDEFIEDAGGVEYFEWYLLYNKTIDWLVDNTIWLDQDGKEVVYPTPTPVPTPAPTATVAPAK